MEWTYVLAEKGIPNQIAETYSQSLELYHWIIISTLYAL